MELSNNGCWGGIRWQHLTTERLESFKCLERYGYKCYSQNDEDGIIEEIFNRIGTTNKIFVEFGVENGLESNAHLLLFKGFSGLWIEGNKEFYNSLCSKFYPVIKNGQLQVINAFITRENINRLIEQSNICGEIDMLSIDLDGNDYYIWDAIEVIKPRLVIIEYNAKFPPSIEWVTAYDENHIWDGTDWYGASLKALENLGKKKGYQLVGTGINGVNAYFVKKELAGEKFILPASAETLYNPSRLGLKHIAGHPSGVCLCGQKENAGIFDYYPDKIAVPQFGFDVEETWADGRPIHWIINKESRILINASRIVGKEMIYIKYVTFPIEKKQLFLNIDINGKPAKRNFQVVTEGEIKLALEQVSEKTGIVPIDIEISHLLRVSEEFGGEDTRKLGIAIFVNEIRAE